MCVLVTGVQTCALPISVPRRQGRRYLAEEDGEREVPRRDAHPGAPPLHPQHVALAGRPRQLHRLEVFASLRRIVAAEIDRLAYLGKRVGDGLLRLLHRDPRSEEHTSELQSLMRISYAVFCLKKK